MTDEHPYASTTCPYCGAVLEPLPEATSRCRSCYQEIFVRPGPDGYRYLLQGVDLAVLEDAWAEYHAARAAEDERERNAQLVGWAISTLADYRAAGVEAIELIGADDPCPACAAALALGRYPVESAPGLPIPGCTSDLCRCDYVPVST